MAEFLVMAKDHWMDKLAANDLKKRLEDKDFERKYNARYVKGDIVEVREDGYWSKDHGFNKAVFGVLCVPGVDHKEQKHLEKAQIKLVNAGTEDERREIVKRRQYNLDSQQVDFSLMLDKTITVANMPTQAITDKSK